jgi:hypothetical protein
MPVSINEFLTSNLNGIKDPADTDPDDWIEVYNSGNVSVDLGGCWLTDDAASPQKFMVPANGQYRIPAGGFLLVWADSEANQNRGDRADLHASFKLTSSPGFIGLYAPDGSNVIDSVTYNTQTTDVSQGRYTDGTSNQFVMTRPTPRGFNGIPGTNTAPRFGTITNTIAVPGQVVTVLARVTDPDVQLISYTIETAPVGSSILPNGAFRWAVPANQPIGDYQVTVTGTDNGTPPMSDTTTFFILVRSPSAPVVAIIPGPKIYSFASFNGQTTFTIATTPGKTYRVFYKDDLAAPAWTQLGPDFVAANSTASLSDAVTLPQRFYRVFQVD